MTAFADRTVVTIAVSMGDRVDLPLFGFCSKMQYSLFLSNWSVLTSNHIFLLIFLYLCKKEQLCFESCYIGFLGFFWFFWFFFFFPKFPGPPTFPGLRWKIIQNVRIPEDHSLCFFPRYRWYFIWADSFFNNLIVWWAVSEAIFIGLTDYSATIYTSFLCFCWLKSLQKGDNEIPTETDTFPDWLIDWFGSAFSMQKFPGYHANPHYAGEGGGDIAKSWTTRRSGNSSFSDFS